MPGGLHTTKAEVLIRATALLQARLPEFGDRIYIVVEDVIPASLQGGELLTVQITGGNFDTNAMMGNVVPYEGFLRVILWNQMHSDQPGTAPATLTFPGRGLLRIQTKVMKALIGSYLEATDCGGDGFTPILTDSIKPVSDSQSQIAKGEGMPGYRATCSIDFRVAFHWDLDGDVDNEPGSQAV